ncbi:MAG: FAD-dependent oxidoreductase [Faecousia sp.]
MKYVKELKCDLCVLGGGGAGLTAAAKASTLTDKKIIVLEKANYTGGGACQAADFRVYGSKWQKERGLDDNLLADLRKRMDETYWELDRKLVYNAFMATGEFFDWCCTLSPDCADRFVPGRYVFDQPDRGPVIPAYAGLPEERKMAPPPMSMPSDDDGDDDKPKGPPTSGPGMRGGTYFMHLMKETCDKNGVEIILNARVSDCEVENGKISAVLAETAEGVIRVSCSAVIMATGSWIRNQKYLEMANPVYAAMPTEKPRPSGHLNSNYTGDGIPLAEKVGAFVDYDSFCIRAMGPGMASKTGEALMPRGQMAAAMSRSPYAIMVDEKAQRFICEPSGPRFAIEDSAFVILRHGSTSPYVVFGLENAKFAAQKNAEDQANAPMDFMGRKPVTPDQVEADLDSESFMIKADTLEELAEKMDVPADNLIATVALYNENCAKGFDSDCFKDPEYLMPIEAPYYAVITALNTDGAFGGVLVNSDIQAYSKDGGLIEGLWVPGDFSSGRFVNDRGLKRQVINDLAWAFASGYISGCRAAEYLDSL